MLRNQSDSVVGRILTESESGGFTQSEASAPEPE